MRWGAQILLLVAVGVGFRRMLGRSNRNPVSVAEPQSIRAGDDVAALLDVADARVAVERDALREICQQSRSRLVGVVLPVLAVVVALTYLALLDGPPSEGPRFRFDGSAWWSAMRGFLEGRITGPVAMTINIALMTVCATLTIALAVGRDNSDEARIRVAQMQWRYWLTSAAGVATAAEVMFGVFTWVGSTARDHVGYSIGADVAAVVAVLLVIALQTETNDASHKLAAAGRVAELRAIRVRRRLITGVVVVPEWRWKSRSRRVVYTYAPRLALGAVLTVTVTLGAQACVGYAIGEPISLTWGDVGDGAGLVVLQAGVFLMQIVLTYSGWTRPGVSWSDIGAQRTALAGQAIYLVSLGVYALFHVTEDPVVWSGFFVCFVMGSAGMWGALAWTRRHRSPWLSVFVPPLWVVVDQKLDEVERRLWRELEEDSATVMLWSRSNQHAR